MKQITIKSAMRLFMAAMLLSIGAVSASAQYYMNIRKTDGSNVRYVVTDIDSVWFSESAVVNYEYVDLGLSVKWATCNVGASSPEDYGDHYAWGETEPKTTYDWSTYKYCNGSYSTLTKYCNNSSYGNNGFTDTKTTLDPDDDVAHLKWGGDWRMPTRDEFLELLNNCTWTWTTLNGVNGYRVTSIKSGYTDRSIFLPAAGDRDGTYLDYVGSRGNYWSSSLDTDYPNDAWIVDFDSGGRNAVFNHRYNGLSVRPVCPSEEWLNALSITISSSLDSIAMGGTNTLSATVKHGDEIIERTVTWTSDNPSIASVSETGVVTGNAVGSTTITATCMGKTATCTITVIEHKVDGYEVDGYENEYEYVDLGLSVNWATFNVGATKPEEYGDYYAWGETETKSSYTWTNYKFLASYNSWINLKFSKYNYSSSYGTVDNKTVLDPEDDVAHVKWGGDWRLPTKAEQDELLNNCTWTWYDSGNTEFNGVAGYKVTSNKSGYIDRFIFLPAAGYRYDSNLYYEGSNGYLWYSSLYPDDPSYARSLNFSSGSHGTNSSSRCGGQSVRPVCPSKEWLNTLSITISSSLDSIVIYGTRFLSATVKNGNEIITDREVTWSSGNPLIASVSETGIVTGNAVGSTTITAICMGKTATFTITVIEQQNENGYEYVDLGLSVNWATFNVGALSPEDFGSYYAWGEMETKDTYDWSTYKWCNGSGSTLTKYNTSSSYGIVDNKTVLDPEDDVAHVKWGGGWRMPTKAEQNELSDSCTWTWYNSGNTEFDGVAGYKVTSNVAGYTDRSIFLPAAGYRDDMRLLGVGSSGYWSYWSSSLRTDLPNCVWYLGSGGSMSYTSRYFGQPVRPVCPSEEWLDALSITLSSSLDSIAIGRTITLSASVKHGNEKIDREVIWSSGNPSIASVSETGVVTGNAVGSTTITASCMGKTATCIITVIEPQNENGYEYVDLGLSVKWATCNVGATKPEEYGDYYAWGETETKNDYSWSTYKWCNGSKYTLTKYNNSSSYGIVDNKTILDPEDDVAHVKWGGSWRMPTGAELEELRNSCIWEWLSDGNNMFNGVAGYLVTSRVPGYQDRFIFLPAAGTRNGTYLNGPGSNGLIWSRSLCTNSTVSADDCIIFYFYSYPGTVSWGNYPRCDGYSVRPVCLTEEWLNALSITLSSSLDSIAIGGTITLSATVKNGDEIIDSEVTWSSDNPSIASVRETGVVTGNAVGSTTITATCMGKTATCTITVIEHKVDGYENEYEYVDLGLSVKWATCNVGASSPEDYGDHYAWGETEPKTTYDWLTYKFRTSGDSYLNLKFSKYNTNSDYGTVDNKAILDPEDDVAHVKWGGNWRMPTKAEQDELRSNCTWTWYRSGNTEFNGVAGYKVTSNKSGYTDRFIFLPAAGYRGGTSLSSAGELGNYWSSSLGTDFPSFAQFLYFNSGSHYTNSYSRNNGHSVRPVCP